MLANIAGIFTASRTFILVESSHMKMFRLILLSGLSMLLLPAFVRAERGNDLVHARLLTSVATLKPGEPFQVGVMFKIAPGWHIYWTNPGDSGMATSVKLDLPPGFLAGEVQYPVPTRLDLPGDIVNYVYENEVMLIVPVTSPKDFSAGSPVKISAKVAWLVCQDVCLPGSATLATQLPTSDQAKPASSDTFVQWNRRVPVDADPDRVAGINDDVSIASSQGRLTGSEQIRIRWKAVPKDIQWFPGPSTGFGPTDIKMITAGDTTTISFHFDRPKNARMESVLGYTIPNGTRMGLNIRSDNAPRSQAATQPG
jgi:DsbC/DsbD-like thiol-disulfide interchange protein